MYADFMKDMPIPAPKPGLTVTCTKPPIEHRKPGLAYYWRVLKWLVKHRSEADCRQKWRRMEREIGGDR